MIASQSSSRTLISKFPERFINSSSFHSFVKGKMQEYFKVFGHNCNVKTEKQKRFESFLQSKNKFVQFIINIIVMDSSLANSTQNIKSYAAIMNEKICHLENNLWTIHPYSLFLLYWNFVVALSILVGIIYSPLQCVKYFSDNLTQKEFRIHNTTMVVTSICTLDMLVTFFAGFDDKKLGVRAIDKIFSESLLP